MMIKCNRKLFIWATLSLLLVFILGSKAFATTEAKLLPSDGALGDDFGSSVSISGDVALVGAPYDSDNGYESGSAYIFRWNGSSWVQEQKLLASDGAAGDDFGSSVSISGDVALVGALRHDDNGRWSGSAYIFRYNGSSWVEKQKLLASDGAANDLFGKSVSISGDVALVGAPYDDDNSQDSGSAYVFRYNGSNWVQEQKLLASDGDIYDYFGSSVSISGNVALVGVYFDDDKGDRAGSAYVFRWNGSSWVQEQKLFAFTSDALDFFGGSVSISGNVALVGAEGDDDLAINSGSAYVFRYNGSSWVQEQKLLASDGSANDLFGSSVSISGDVALVGAVFDDDNGTYSGSAYVFRWSGSSWVEQEKLLASDGDIYDYFGRSVSISGNLALVGVPGSYDSPTDSGSAYVYSLEMPFVVDFLANPTRGPAPLTVSFTDQSTGNITSWNWNFGDGTSSTIQNPSNTYTNEGHYDVSLTVSGPYGLDIETKTDYISVGADVDIWEDDFNDGIIDRIFWRVEEVGDVNAEETNGYVEISAPPLKPSGHAGLISNLVLDGDFDVWLDYDWVYLDGDLGARWSLRVVSNDGTEEVILNNHRWDIGNSREIILHKRVNETSTIVTWISADSVPLSGALRIQRVGATINGYYRESGGSWILLGKTDLYADKVRPYFRGSNSPYDPASSFTVHLDNFHAEANWIIFPEPKPMPWIPLLLLDD